MTFLPSPACVKCPLLERLPTCYVPASRVKGAQIAIVGEAPGAKEVEGRRGFVGASGRLLDSLLFKAGISRAQVTVTNVLKCQPLGNELPRDLPLAISCCSSLLERDLEGTRVVIGLGNVPLLALTGKRGIMKHRGSVYPLEGQTENAKGRWFVGTLHPAALLRSRWVKGEGTKVVPSSVVVADLRRAKGLLEREPEIPKDDFFLYPNAEEKSLLLSLLEDPEREVGVDIETTWGEKVEEKLPLLIGFDTEEIGLCVDFEDLDFIARALESPSRKIFHHGISDVSVLTYLGFTVEHWYFDTLYGHHTAFAELPHSLAFVQSLYCWLPFHKDMMTVEEEEEVWGE